MAPTGPVIFLKAIADDAAAEVAAARRRLAKQGTAAERAVAKAADLARRAEMEEDADVAAGLRQRAKKAAKQAAKMRGQQ